MVKRVVLSSDSNPLYAFYVPLTVLMWREVGAYHPLVLSVGELPPLVRDKTHELIRREDVVTMDHPKCCGMVAATQLVRLLAYMAPGIEPTDYLLMGDVDAWPLQSGAFEPTPGLFLMYDASTQLDVPGVNTPAFPIGYIGARASLWRELLKIDATSLREGLEMLFLTDTLLAAGGVNADEALITKRIKAWHGYPGECHQVARHGFPCRGRIDRGKWPANVRLTVNDSKDPFIDAHLLRPGWDDANWPRVRPLLEMFLPHKWMAWCDAYRDEYLGGVR